MINVWEYWKQILENNRINDSFEFYIECILYNYIIIFVIYILISEEN